MTPLERLEQARALIGQAIAELETAASHSPLDLVRARHAGRTTTAAKLRAAALSRGLTAAQLAHRAGLSPTRVHALLAGADTPTADEQAALLEALPDWREG